LIRVLEFGKALRFCENHVHVLLKGELGMGKTYLLNKLWGALKNEGVIKVRPSFNKNDLNTALSERVRVNGMTWVELFNELKSISRSVVYLFIDDLHLVTNKGVRCVLELSNVFVLVCAAESIPKRLSHLFEVIELKPLSFGDSCALIKEVLMDKRLKLGDGVVRLIAFRSGGVALFCVQGLEYYLSTGEFKTFRPVLSWNGFVRTSLSIAYFLMSLRYLFLFRKNWALYSATSLIAYLLLSFFRYKRK